MARKKRPDEEEEYKHKKYDFTREHIRGIYIERERFVLPPNCQAGKARGFELISTCAGDLYPKDECK